MKKLLSTLIIFLSMTVARAQLSHKLFPEAYRSFWTDRFFVDASTSHPAVRVDSRILKLWQQTYPHDFPHAPEQGYMLFANTKTGVIDRISNDCSVASEFGFNIPDFFIEYLQRKALAHHYSLVGSYHTHAPSPDREADLPSMVDVPHRNGILESPAFFDNSGPVILLGHKNSEKGMDYRVRGFLNRATHHLEGNPVIDIMKSIFHEDILTRSISGYPPGTRAQELYKGYEWFDLRILPTETSNPKSPIDLQDWLDGTPTYEEWSTQTYDENDELWKESEELMLLFVNENQLAARKAELAKRARREWGYSLEVKKIVAGKDFAFRLNFYIASRNPDQPEDPIGEYYIGPYIQFIDGQWSAFTFTHQVDQTFDHQSTLQRLQKDSRRWTQLLKKINMPKAHLKLIKKALG